MSLRRHARGLTLAGGVAAAIVVAPSALAGSAGAAQPEAAVPTHDRAGYAVTAHETSKVSAHWVVPTAICGADDTYASFRIALRSGSHVTWVGTAVECHAGTASYFAWQGDEHKGHRFGPKVLAGDAVAASLSAHGRRSSMSFEDDTRGWGVAGGGVGPFRMHYTTATVGVVAVPGATGLLPLADFSRTSFSQVLVNKEAIDGQQPARLVMKSHDGTVLAAAGRLHDSTFMVTRRNG